MEGRLVMSEKDRVRLSLCYGYRDRKYTVAEVAETLGLSRRQASRILKRFAEEGDSAVIHRARGKPSNHQLSTRLKQTVLGRYQDRYQGFGPTLAAEKLAEEGLRVDPETLRLWLKAAGFWKQARKRKKLRKKRERRERFGELLQLDGSIHDWFGQGRLDCLMNLIDDATGTVVSFMDDGETTYAALRVLEKWIERYGVPKAIYVDLKTVYVSPRNYKAAGMGAPEPTGFTHFSKACARLGIQIIKAYSPQAKGRVERVHRVFQDRFIKELQLEGITTLEGANRLLDQRYLAHHNRKFTHLPANSQDAHRSAADFGPLKDILCWEYERVLDNNGCIRFAKQLLHIHAPKDMLYPRATIRVKQHLDHTLSVWCNTTEVRYKPLKDNETVREEKVKCPKQQIPNKPAAHHPWRGRFIKQEAYKPTPPLTLQPSASQPVPPHL